VNDKIMAGLHPDDQRSMREYGFVKCTNPATEAFVSAMLLDTVRAVRELLTRELKTLREELRKEFEGKIHFKDEEIRDLKARQTLFEMRQATTEQRLSPLKKTCEANRRHAENLERKLGELLHR
jgi:chromosome segregation ATPase